MSKATKRILALSLPIMGGMMSQNILNLVDTLMIGRLGALALAGSGIGAFLFYVLFVFIIGLSSGVQTIVARHLGENNRQAIPLPLQLGLSISVFIAIIITGLTLFVSTPLTTLFSDNATVASIGNDYLRFRILGLPFFAICLVIRGFWNGMETPIRYLKVIVLIHGLNILLNTGFIFGYFGFPALGAAGAGLASSIALIVGAIIYLIDARYYAFNAINRPLVMHHLKWLKSLSIPISLQQIAFAGGIATFYWILGQLGPNAMAIGNVLVNILLIAILPGVALGLTTMTLVSESLGKKDYLTARDWPLKVAKFGALIIGLFSLIVFVFPTIILKQFLSDPALISIGIIPIRLDAIGVFLEVGALIYMHALYGSDKTKVVAIISTVLHWLFYLPGAYYCGVVLGLGINSIWIFYTLFQLFQLSIFSVLWYRSPQLLTNQAN